MDTEDLIKQAERIIETGKNRSGASVLAEATEFLRVYAGERSTFYKQLARIDISRPGAANTANYYATGSLTGFIEYVKNGLLEGLSIERKAQLDVVSDFLEQANVLLNSSDVHPAAPTVIIGASLEEFLRNWVEEAGLGLGEKKPSLDSYAKVLREAELITKQDIKDVTSWSGLRNHAAHGEWNEVNDKGRILVMLEGVNLFMRRYGEKGK